MYPTSGYAGHLVRERLPDWQSKRLFGKPYVKYGVCYTLAAYFMQVGVILSVRHRHNLGAFWCAFLGMGGETGAVERFLSLASQNTMRYVTESMSFVDFVQVAHSDRFKYSGDSRVFLLKYGPMKLTLGTAIEMLWQFAEHGAILGATNPGLARAIFEYTHRPMDKQKWDRACAVLGDMPTQQGTMSYDECDECENGLFVMYCRQYCPSLRIGDTP